MLMLRSQSRQGDMDSSALEVGMNERVGWRGGLGETVLPKVGDACGCRGCVMGQLTALQRVPVAAEGVFRAPECWP